MPESTCMAALSGGRPLGIHRALAARICMLPQDGPLARLEELRGVLWLEQIRPPLTQATRKGEGVLTRPGVSEVLPKTFLLPQPCSGERKDDNFLKESFQHTVFFWARRPYYRHSFQYQRWRKHVWTCSCCHATVL